MNQHQEFVVPAGTPLSHCRGCDAEVYWIVTRTGKRMPVDCQSVAGHHAPTAREPGLGVSHFATCGQADAFRKARAGQGAS